MTREEFCDTLSAYAAELAVTYNVKYRAQVSSFYPNVYTVAAVDDKGRVLDANSAVSFHFSQGSTGRELVSIDYGRRCQINKPSITVAKFKILSLFRLHSGPGVA